jgi:hypothetical protein
MPNTAGTKNSATVARPRPRPRRPRGAFCSALAEADRHWQHADDHASAVISTAGTGESGVDGGVDGAAPRAISSFAKLTTRMLLAVATPTHMIALVSHADGVPRKQHPEDAGKRRGALK